MTPTKITVYKTTQTMTTPESIKPPEQKTLSFQPELPPDDADIGFTMDLDNMDSTSTYTALSYFVREWKKAGGRNPTFIPRKVIGKLFDAFEEKSIDISSTDCIPYDADDLHDVLMLLARIQNKGASQSGDDKGFAMHHLLEDTLIDRSQKMHKYDIGERVEVLGPSMVWRLEHIQNILKTHDDDGETPIYIYETTVDHELREDEMRWPKEALIRIFGYGPWIWQEWACLRLENKLSFQQGSNTDFEFFDIPGYVKELWNVWFLDERNKSFRELFDRVGESGQEQLLHHILSPFDLMDDVISNKDERWDFVDAGISIFTYVSLLGSGFVDAFMVFLLQLAMPVFLFFYYSSLNEDGSIAVGTREMLFSVLLYYVFKVTRDVWSNFVRVVGISEEAYSKIQSLREDVWNNGNDSLAQSFGYIGDQFMNTGYICFLYLFNMWILFNVTDPFEILGSVIFFEFLFDLDEDVANSQWWDRRKRFLKVGVVGLIMQVTVQQEDTHTRAAYLKKVGKELSLTEEEIQDLDQKCEDAGLPSGSAFLGSNEADEMMQLLTMAERVSVLRQMDGKASVKYLLVENPKVYFTGIFGSDSALFQRHSNLRAWSQWEKLLFLFPTPTLVPKDYVEGSKLEVNGMEVRSSIIEEQKKDVAGLTRGQRFWRSVYRVLTCKEFTGYSYGPSSSLKTWAFFISRLVHAFFSWTSHVIQLLFPFLTFAALVVVFLKDGNGDDVYCYLHRGTCIFEESVFGR